MPGHRVDGLVLAAVALPGTNVEQQVHAAVGDVADRDRRHGADVRPGQGRWHGSDVAALQRAARGQPGEQPSVERPVADEAPRRAKKELPPDEIVVSSTSTAPADEKPKKAGWWQRGFFGN